MRHAVEALRRCASGPVGTVALAACAALLSIGLFARTKTSYLGFQTTISLSPWGWGETHVVLGPLGEVVARTHAFAGKLELNLTHVDITRAAAILQLPSLDSAANGLEQLARGTILRLSGVVLGSGTAGGLASSLFLRRFYWPRTAAAGLIGLAVALILVLGVGLSYDIGAFATPVYHGVLEFAPQALALTDATLSNAQRISSQVGQITDNLSLMLQRADLLLPVDDRDQVTVLAVSDIHNNALAFDMIQALVQRFSPSFVVDAGDLTDWGSPIETTILRRLEDMPVPYVFAAGNHETPFLIHQLAATPQVEVLGGQPFRSAGLTVLGSPDPSAFRNSPTVASTAELDALARSLELKLNMVAAQVAVVHSPKVAEQLVGRVPVIITGHTHTPSLTERSGSVLINVGTTGGAGIRGLMIDHEVPLTAALLRFSPGATQDGLVLTAVDTVSLSYRSGEMSVSRHLVRQSGPAAAAGEGGEQWPTTGCSSPSALRSPCPAP